jgi:hypothetical protein
MNFSDCIIIKEIGRRISHTNKEGSYLTKERLGLLLFIFIYALHFYISYYV